MDDLKEMGIVCPVSQQLMVVPVQLDPCGHIVSRDVIECLKTSKCPVCSNGIIGYSRSQVTEYKVDEFARMHLQSGVIVRPISSQSQDVLDFLTKSYGKKTGIEIYLKRVKPYTLVKQKAINWGWIRYIIDKLFFMFCTVSSVAFWYYV